MTFKQFIKKNGFSVVVALTTLLWFVAWMIWKKVDDENAFQGLDSLFAALAFGGVIFTVYQQKKELALQRKELKETRKEFHQQNQTLKKQRFENTFFNLVSLQHEITSKDKTT